MRTLSTLDAVVVIVFLVVSLLAGVIWTKNAGRSMTDFFLSGRSLPWWLAGVSMAATNFSIDTPLAVTKYVSQYGIPGVWFLWSQGIAAVLAAFVFARLWRRAEVLTDAELVELRYSGRSAAALRLFKGIYFGVFLNCFVLGWVLKAVVKVMSGVTDLPVVLVLGVAVTVAFAYTITAGLKGVVWTDFVQYGVGFAGSIALAVYAVAEVGGIDGLLQGLDERLPDGAAAVSLLPTATDVQAVAGGFEIVAMPTSVFVVYLTMQWWAQKYADGGGKHIQRMMACRSEGDAQGAAILFAAFSYGLQVWPWIITALAAMVILGPLEDPEMGYPLLMARLLPSGVLGLLVATMLGAFMSTVDTHLNLGASYLVNDVYRRFLKPDASPRHYVRVSRLAMLVILAVAIGTAMSIDSVGDAWKFLFSFVSGAGLVWIARWFWWRINPWSELAAMLASGVTTIVLTFAWEGSGYTDRLVVIVAVSTVAWLSATFATAPSDEQTLVRFIERLRPGRFGWARIYDASDLSPEPFLGPALIDAAFGVMALYGMTFGIGASILGRHGLGALLLTMCVTAAASLVVRARLRRS